MGFSTYNILKEKVGITFSNPHFYYLDVMIFIYVEHSKPLKGITNDLQLSNLVINSALSHNLEANYFLSSTYKTDHIDKGKN